MGTLGSLLDPLGALADALNAWYVSLLKQIVSFLFVITVPTVTTLKSDFFSIGLGGTFGLATKLIGVLTVLLTFIVLLRPNRNHGMKISRLLTTMVMIVVFGYLFYPVYSLLYTLSQGLTQAAINLATSSPTGSIDQLNKLFAGTTDTQIMNRLITSAVAGMFAFLTFMEALTLRVALFVVLLFYPLMIALRPIGGAFRTLFNISNSAIAVIIASPPIMGFLFVLPVIIAKYIPGGQLPGVSVILTIVGGFLAMITPIFLALVSFRASREVFGKLDSNVAGSIDIGSIPPVTVDDANRDVREVHRSTINTVMADVVGDGIMNDNLFDDMKKTTINVVGTAAAAAGHPYIGMAVKGGDAIITKVKTKPSSTEGGEDS